MDKPLEVLQTRLNAVQKKSRYPPQLQLASDDIIYLMSKCIFCNFKDDGVVVYDDEKCFVAVSLNPINKYHLMVIPNKHYENFVELPDELASHIFKIAKRVSLAVRKTCDPLAIHHISDDDVKKKGYNLVSHYKFHIIPRFKNDKIVMKWNRYKLTPKERSEIADDVKENL